VGLWPDQRPVSNHCNNDAFIFQQLNSLASGPFALGSENFCKLDQSGILAQKFSVCGNLVRGLFPFLQIQNPNQTSCQVFKL